MKKNKLIFTAFSKEIFYHRFSISKYILKQGNIPINPFMNFDYYLGEGIDRNIIRRANNKIVEICDELWVFGEISDGVRREEYSDGVIREINIAKSKSKTIRYYSVDDCAKIKEEVERGAARNEY